MKFRFNLPKKIIKTALVFQQFSTDIPQIIQIIFAFIGQLAIISYIEEPTFSTSEKFTIILFLTRPHLYLFIEGNYWVTVIVIFILMQLLFGVWIYYCNILNSSSKKNIIVSIENLQQKSKKTKFLIQLISIFLFCNKSYLGANIIEFCLLALLRDSRTEIIVISFFLMIEVMTLLIMEWQFTNRSIKLLPQLQHLMINSSDSNICNFVFKVLQIIIYVISSNNALIGQSILVICTFLHKLTQIQWSCPYMKNSFQFVIILCSCFGITIGVLQIIATQYENFHSRIWIILLPIVIYICKNCLETELHQLLLKSQFEEFSISQLKYIICMLFNGIDIDQSGNLIIIYHYLIKNQKIFKKVRQITKRSSHKASKILINLICSHFESLTSKTKNQIKLQQIYLNFIQILIKQNRYVEAKQIIEQIKLFQKKGQPQISSKNNKFIIRAQFSGIQLIYLEILENKIQSCVQKTILQSCHKRSVGNQTISNAMRQLSIINSNQIDVQQIFRNVIDLKIEFLTFVQKDQIDSILFNRKAQHALNEMESLRRKLKSNYQLFPTTQNQSILTLYQIEILNNVLDAYNFSNTIALDEDVILKHHQSEMFNFFNQSFNFIIFEIHAIQNIKIKYHSINQGFSYCIVEGEQLQSLVPSSLKQFHQQLVERFLQNGQNKFFQQIDETFIQIRPGILQPIDICMDLNHKNTQNIEVLTVYRSMYDEKQLIFVDQYLKIQEISLYLFQRGFNLQENQLHYIIGIHVQKVIPNFKKYIDEKVYEVKNCSLYFLSTTQDEQDSKTKSKTINAFDDFEQIANYSCHLTISIRKFTQDQLYYVLRIDSLKQDRIYSCSQFKLTQNSEHQDFDEEIEINLPDIDHNEEQRNIILNTDRYDTQFKLLPQEFVSLKDKKQTDTSVVRLDVVNIHDNEHHSNVTSIAQIKRSPHYKKFVMISEIINSKKKSPYLIAFSIVYVSYVLLVLSFCANDIAESYKLKQFVSDIELLSIKNEVYHPIEKFLLTRYTIVTYNSLLSNGTIDQQQYNQLISFPKADLLDDYDELKVSVVKVLNIPEFQPFLEDNYIEVFLYEKTNIGILYNMTFRLAIHLLLDYQYEFKLGYTIKPLIVDGPYFYYSYKNYIILFNEFQKLNDYTLQNTKLLSEKKQYNIKFVMMVSSILAALLIFVQINKQIQITNLKNKILNLIKNVDFDQADQEIKKLQQFKVIILQNRDTVYDFHFDMEHVDKQLKLRSQNFKQKAMNARQTIKLNTFLTVSIIIIHYVVFFCLSLAFYLVSSNYLTKYITTAEFYQQASNADIDVLIIYAQKEVLYYQTLMSYLNSSDIQQIYDQINSSVASLSSFSNNLVRIDEMNNLFGDEASEIISNLTLTSICDNLSDDYKIRAQYICNTVMQGALTKGLLNSLFYMISSIKIEYQDTRFYSRTALPELQLEGATLVSNVLQNLVESLKLLFQNTTEMYQINIYIIISIFMFFEIISIYCLIYTTRVQQMQLDLLKKFLYLIPGGTLFNDEQFARNLKRMISYQQLT